MPAFEKYSVKPGEDEIAAIEQVIVDLDIRIDSLELRANDIENQLYIGVERAYDEAVSQNNKKEMQELSNEKKRKLKVKELLNRHEDYFEVKSVLEDLLLEKLYALIDLGIVQREFAVKHGSTPNRQIAKEKRFYV